jgi:hypothetical protein
MYEETYIFPWTIGRVVVLVILILITIAAIIVGHDNNKKL